MDAGWISIADDYTILVREDLPDHDDYRFIAEYEGEKIRLPSVAEAAPNEMYLQEHRKLMGFDQVVVLGVNRRGLTCNHGAGGCRSGLRPDGGRWQRPVCGLRPDRGGGPVCER
jgi:hypothetical protein